MSPQDSSSHPAASPWWRHGHLWLVLGGPALVVAASIVTAVIAARGADVPLELRKASVVRQDAAGRAQLPALQGRNHANTPVANP